MSRYDLAFRLKVVRAYRMDQPYSTYEAIANLYGLPSSTVGIWVRQYNDGQLDDIKPCKANSPHGLSLKTPLKEILRAKLEYHEDQIRQIRQAQEKK